MTVDLYDILGVARGADDDAIKQAFRQLARKFHPDRNPDDPEAEERFKEALAAFEILSDPEKRRRYDREGLEGVESPDKAGVRGGVRDDGDPDTPWWAENGELGETFSEIFGGKSPFDISHFEDVGGFEPDSGAATGPSAPRPDPEDGADVHRSLEVGLVEAARGDEVTLEIGGESVRIRLEAGVETGDRLRVPGRGRPAPDERGEDGDLVLEIEVRDHPTLRRDGLDLEFELPVTVTESILGASVEVPTLEGPVEVELPAGLDSGTRLRIEGKGVRRGEERGDLYGIVRIVAPHRVDEAIEAAARTLERGYTRGVRDVLDFDEE